MATSMDDARSTGTSQSKAQKWKELGMSRASNAGNSFTSLLRSAGRKSSDSLRSLRSNASRKSKSSKVDTSRSDVPPMPNLSTEEQQRLPSISSDRNKALPPSPFPSSDNINKDRGAAAAPKESNGNIDSNTDEPFESYNLSPEVPASASNDSAVTSAAAILTPATANTTGPSTSQTITGASNGDVDNTLTTSRESADYTTGLKPSETLGSRIRNSSSNLRNATSRTSLADLDENQIMTSATTPSSRRSFSKLRKNNGSTPKLATESPAAAAGPTSGTLWASEKNGGGDGNTIAQLYAVFGLPKDPAVWTLAEEDCVAGVHHTEGAVGRFWRPEVLGCSICPTPSEVLSKIQPTEDKESGASKWSGRDAGGKKPSNPKFIEMADGRGSVEKAETARVLSKALKLSFTREIEIIAEQGNYPPLATSHTFSFSVPTTSSSDSSASASPDGKRVAGAMGVSIGKASASRGVGEGFGLENRAKVQGAGNTDLDDGPSLATFYGVVLTVWSAADEKRAKTIKRELNRAAKQRGSLSTPKTLIKKSPDGDWTGDGDNNAAADEEDDRVASPTANSFAANSTFFMPYAICIVSRYPLYNLLGDWNKMAWHKYSRNIEMHNQLMSTILRHPAPRLGEKFSVGSPDKDLSFHCTFPGAMEWGTGLIGIDMIMWPLFKTLSLDNILTVCEVALAHNGRVLFQSRHPALLGIAVETIRYLVELNGWKGVANQNCHARDVKIYLEDPGSWIIAINSELRSIIKPAKEVCLVDLDINFVNCIRPPLGAISKGQNRDKKKRRLLQGASALVSVESSPPREITEAYPGGRFRPLSTMITRDSNSAYEQLAVPIWWNQTDVIQTFDRLLRQGTKPTFLKKVLMQRQSKVNQATDTELNAILGLRKRASTFVDARDGLENKIGRLNKRLAFLMSESEMWRAQFGKIQSLVDRLTKEANDLRAKVDKERRESRRLSTSLAERDMEQVQIRLQLKETEMAREEAQADLLKMQRAMESLETERESMMDEIRAVISGEGGVEDVNLSLAKLDCPFPSYNPLIRSDSPTGSQVSMTPSQAAEYIMKSRAMAEAKINEPRPGRAMSRDNSVSGHFRSLSQDRGERQRKNPIISAAQSTTSHVNHFPDDQMNYEIQQRTSIVTNQISKIQAQLENTLTQLEGRRNGGYDRDTDRRRIARRISNASNLSSRYEYRANSSMGHGAPASSIGHGSEIEDVGNDSFDSSSQQMEQLKGEVEEEPRSRKRREAPAPLGLNGNLRVVSPTGLTPTALTPTALSPTALSPTVASPMFLANSGIAARSPTSPLFANANGGSSLAMLQQQQQPIVAPPKSQARQQDASNPWKEVAITDSNSKKVTADNSLNSTQDSSLKTPLTYESEVMLASTPAFNQEETATLKSDQIPLLAVANVEEAK